MLFELSYSFLSYFPVFFFDDTATTEIYTLSLHDALPISSGDRGPHRHRRRHHDPPTPVVMMRWISARDRKSTRLNSSHITISYAVFCLKKKKRIITLT